MSITATSFPNREWYLLCNKVERPTQHKFESCYDVTCFKMARSCHFSCIFFMFHFSFELFFLYRHNVSECLWVACPLYKTIVSDFVERSTRTALERNMNFTILYDKECLFLSRAILTHVQTALIL